MKAKESVIEKENLYEKTKNKLVNVIDENGNGEIDIEDVIIKSLKLPGIKIDRTNFLQKQFEKLYPQETINIAINENPMTANIPLSEIDKLANNSIKFERNCVSGISAVLGAPGGWTVLATIPADIAQYYGYMLRAMQKLLYLYGFPQIDLEKTGAKFDDATMNTLILCFGVMYGVAGANTAIRSMAKGLVIGVEKQLLKTALTKGVFYPIVRKVMKWFGVNLTKKVFAKFFGNVIPLAGSVIGGGITYLSFKPCCDKLKNTLRDTMLSNKNYSPKYADDLIFEDYKMKENLEDNES